MSNEATVRCSLQIRKVADDGTVLIDYRSSPTGFVADVSGTKGPCPGAFAVSISGTDIDLSQLEDAGLAWCMNQDETNYVTLGVYEPDTDTFYPIEDWLPGECYVKRFSRHLGAESTGTGTLVGYNSTLQLRANTATCNVVILAFES